LTGKYLLTYNSRMDRTLVRQSDQVFRAIADPTRRDLLDLLAGAEQPVNRLAEPFAMTRPAISQHLRILREAGLVTERKVGRERYYRLEAAPLRAVSEWAARYDRFWRDKLGALGGYLDEKGERP
jgi:DNA-binding transcriptional ArsR family regulator